MKIRPFDDDMVFDIEDEESPQINDSIINILFDFVLYLQQSAVQLKMNHWQTTNFAEHKNTDSFVKILHKYSDEIAETSMGEFQRPKISATHITINDILITSTRWTLDTIREKTNEIISTIKATEYEGILSIITEFDSEFKKAIYLSTLE